MQIYLLNSFITACFCFLFPPMFQIECAQKWVLKGGLRYWTTSKITYHASIVKKYFPKTLDNWRCHLEKKETLACLFHDRGKFETFAAWIIKNLKIIFVLINRITLSCQIKFISFALSQLNNEHDLFNLVYWNFYDPHFF